MLPNLSIRKGDKQVEHRDIDYSAFDIDRRFAPGKCANKEVGKKDL